MSDVFTGYGIYVWKTSSHRSDFLSSKKCCLKQQVPKQALEYLIQTNFNLCRGDTTSHDITSKTMPSNFGPWQIPTDVQPSDVPDEGLGHQRQEDIRSWVPLLELTSAQELCERVVRRASRIEQSRK